MGFRYLCRAIWLASKVAISERTKDLYDFANMEPVSKFLESQASAGQYMPDLFLAGWLFEHGREVDRNRREAAAAAQSNA